MTTVNKRKINAARGNFSNLSKELEPSHGSISRRSFLQTGLAVGAGAAAGGLLPNTAKAEGGLTPGDAALLRFPAALEILEADFWIQYNELAGVQDPEVPGGSGNLDYTEALEVLGRRYGHIHP